jgi:8-oxo-dGTP diphosphatase
MIQVVIGVQSRTRTTPEVTFDDIEYLVGRRSGKAYVGCWEFPGGKVEVDEDPEDALIREWLEELGVDVTVGEELFDQQFTTVDLTNFQATAYRVAAASPHEVAQIPRLAAHDRVEWMSRAAILALPDDQCTPSLKPITRAIPE